MNKAFAGASCQCCWSEVTAIAGYFRDGLGCEIDFRHGDPPFQRSVSRDAARVHLGFVCELISAVLVARETLLILAAIATANVCNLYDKLKERGAAIAQPPAVQPWGGPDVPVRDLDGNVVVIVTYG